MYSTIIDILISVLRIKSEARIYRMQRSNKIFLII